MLKTTTPSIFECVLIRDGRAVLPPWFLPSDVSDIMSCLCTELWFYPFILCYCVCTYGTIYIIIIVTCGLTVCTLGSAPCPTLGNGYGKPLPALSKAQYFCGKLPFDNLYSVYQWQFLMNLELVSVWGFYWLQIRQNRCFVCCRIVVSNHTQM